MSAERFNVPEDIMIQINNMFPNSEERRKIAYTLMFWNKKPVGNELEDVGKQFSRSSSSVSKVLQKLNEEGLFSTDLGSVPLFRYMEKMRVNLRLDVPTSAERVLDVTDLEDEVTELEQEAPISNPSEAVTVETRSTLEPPSNPPVTVPTAYEKELEKRVALQEMELKQFQSRIDGKLDNLRELIERSVNPLSATPPSNPDPSPPQVEQPVQQSLAEPSTPFSDMTGNQVIEMMMNQPDVFAQMMGKPVSQDMFGKREMSALPSTVRRMIVEITAYTQIAYEKAVNDGAFDGSISDFLNQCVYKYFEDRGIVLQWGKYDRVPYLRRQG